LLQDSENRLMGITFCTIINSVL